MTLQYQEVPLHALDHAVDAMVLVDEMDIVRFFNLRAETLWGYSRDEVIGKSAVLLVPADARPGHDGFARHTVTIERKDGEKRSVSLSLSKLEIEGRTHFLCVARDVSDEMGRREQLRLLSLAVNETAETIMVLDSEQHIIYVNRAFTELFGYTLEQVVGQHPASLLAINGTDASVLSRLRDRRWGTQGGKEEAVAQNGRGETISVSIAVNPILDAESRLSNAVVVVTDITPLKRIQSLQEDVLSALAGGAELRAVGDFICRRIEAIAPDVVSSLLLVDEEQRLRPLAGPSLPVSFSASIDGVRVADNLGSCGTAAFRGEEVAVLDIATDPRWETFRELPLGLGLRACWSSPIKLRDGRVAGTFAFYFRQRQEPTPFHKKIVAACLHLCRLAIEQDKARRRIAELSLFDPLTGLPNRTSLLAEAAKSLSEAHGQGSSVAVLVLNLDRFRDVNSSLGHEGGDKVLLETASRLKTVMSGVSTFVSRIGGDSFAVVLPECDAARASFFAERLGDAFATAIEVHGIMLAMGCSIGISILRDGNTDLETLVKQAETAMYDAKANGRGAYRFYSAEMNELAQDRLLLGAALRNALSNRLLKLHYQPQIDLRTDRLHGVEALARWNDPDLGNVSPARFIGLAEELGLIETIGQWSLRESCRQLAEWRQAGIEVPAISVNLSPLHFSNNCLPGFIEGLLREYGLSADSLRIEITENVMMDAGPATLRTLAALHEIGIGLAMDDFGTGFSSLSSLTQLPISELKLDRSFMLNFETDVSAQAVATAVVRIGQSLGMTVVSEGVETERQAQLLRGLECEVAQGYHFAKPMPACDLARWVRSRTPSAVA